MKMYLRLRLRQELARISVSELKPVFDTDKTTSIGEQDNIKYKRILEL